MPSASLPRTLNADTQILLSKPTPPNVTTARIPRSRHSPSRSRSLHRLRQFSLATRAFLSDSALYFIPVLLWLLLFSCGVALIPPSWKPPINVTLLPTIDEWLGSSVKWFGSLSDQYSWLDLLAAVPYTIHPLLPIFFLAGHALLGAPVSGKGRPMMKFVLAFGIMNLAAVLTHLIFPTAPPWYFLKHRYAVATYDMKGDPAVLGRLDEHFDMHMYRTMYEEGGKVVFGAWPSLHAAWPYLMARFRPAIPWRVVQVWQWGYMVLVWWAAIHLKHHFLVDLLGGMLYAEFAYQVAQMTLGGRERDPREDMLPFVVK
eukprot:GFKZ01011622.1.p1 GENE.GFKZ01011622.1~~GFKZ01011622.1.p1  ORF type:complete len:351 (+),score=23.99 GFKZ01011622.1:111-1055(+)